MNKKINWYNSKETKSLLKISDCKLMHLRLEGKIKFKKEGRSYYYLLDTKTVKTTYIKQLAQPSDSASSKISSK
jgi:hypothetical protein